MGMITMEDMEKMANAEGEDPDGQQIDTVYQWIDRLSLFSCSQCGGSILGKWKFCPDCGGAVIWADLKGGPGG